MKPPKPLIYYDSVSRIVQVTQTSTGHRYYAKELQDETGLSKPRLSWALNKLTKAGYMHKQSEPADYLLKRAPRVYYEWTDYGLGAIRLIPPSE